MSSPHVSSSLVIFAYYLYAFFGPLHVGNVKHSMTNSKHLGLGERTGMVGRVAADLAQRPGRCEIAGSPLSRDLPGKLSTGLTGGGGIYRGANFI